MICPSPPMLIIPPRNEMQMPNPTSSSGVALTRVWATPFDAADHAVDALGVGFERVDAQEQDQKRADAERRESRKHRRERVEHTFL
ncbi:MAG: hypothetical protein M5R40_18640 [Anaerolineae bacterium]|nr:hypothetical protein [Anaerolineae bacterium]